MTHDERNARLRREAEALAALARENPILDVEPQGDPPTKYRLTFRGKGLVRSTSPHAEVEVGEVHQCEMRLPGEFPRRPPDIRWLSPIHHPNVSFGGLIRLEDLGLEWEEDVPLEAVCERLWDMTRLAVVHLRRAVNSPAKFWYERQTAYQLPIDPRPLRPADAPLPLNVIEYKRRGERWSAASPDADDPVLYIGENTPTADLPLAPVRRWDERDVLYIGEDS